MEKEIQTYIDGIKSKDIPWNRFFTAYGTAEHYGEILSKLENFTDFDQWKENFNSILEFEHQETLFPCAPFVLVFLVRILKKVLNDETESGNKIAEMLVDSMTYYAEICYNAEEWEHAEPFPYFADMLNERYLLPENIDEDRLDEFLENPDMISDELFYSVYYYSRIILSQVPKMLDEFGKFAEKNTKLRQYF